VLNVEAQNFTIGGESLLAEDSPLPFRFYRDGIRQLLFHKGFTLEELVGFTLIALSERERGADDAVAQLWQADLPHVEYIAVEGFSVDGAGAQEDVDVQIDQIVSYLYQRLRSHSDDYLRFARVAASDLDTRFDGVEQLRGLVVTASPASDLLKQKLQREIQEEEHHRLFPKLVSAVFQVMEAGLRDNELLLDVLVQLLDALLLQEDFATIHQMVLKLTALGKSDNTGALERLREQFVAKMGEEQRVSRVADLLKAGRPRQPAEIRAYLESLDARSVPPLLAVLETVELPENRVLLCDVLVPFAQTAPEPFLVRLQSERPQTVRDMLYIVDRAQYADRAKLFNAVIYHPNLAMRLEVMQLMARSGSAEGRLLLVSLLNDDAPQVRMQAARLLPQMGAEPAYADLLRVIQGASFEKRSFEEKTAIFGGLGATGSPSALARFSEMLEARGNLLNRRRVLEDKLLAVQGLVGARSIQAYQSLQIIAEDPSQPNEVQSAARRGAAWVRKALFNEATEDKSWANTT
jgi:hypothetical protein